GLDPAIHLLTKRMEPRGATASARRLRALCRRMVIGTARSMPTMRAMVLDEPRTPLVPRERALPAPGAGEILGAVAACGVCRTDLHVVDGELPHPALPLVPGHEIVGEVAALGAGVTGFAIGERVGVPWLGHTCGQCPYCVAGRENLCDVPLFTGYTR